MSTGILTMITFLIIVLLIAVTAAICAHNENKSMIKRYEMECEYHLKLEEMRLKHKDTIIDNKKCKKSED